MHSFHHLYFTIIIFCLIFRINWKLLTAYYFSNLIHFSFFQFKTAMYIAFLNIIGSFSLDLKISFYVIMHYLSFRMSRETKIFPKWLMMYSDKHDVKSMYFPHGIRFNRSVIIQALISQQLHPSSISSVISCFIRVSR